MQASQIQPISIRDRICNLEQRILQLPNTTYGDQASCPLVHRFAHKTYVREIFMPKGLIVISKLHKFSYPYFILQGKVSILTEAGVIRLQAPHYGITPAGTKRVLYIHEDTIWVNVHGTEEVDVIKIEEEIIAKSYDDLETFEALTAQDIQALQEVR
jgi:hypothetical protein